MPSISVIRFLHWSIVFSVVVAYTSAYYRHWFTTQSESANWYFLVFHMNVGLVIFALGLLAFFLRRKLSVNTAPVIPVGSQKMARTMHYSLYIMLFALPVSAYIGTGFDFPLLGLVNLAGFMRIEFVQTFVQQDLNLLMITFIEPFAYFHRYIGAALVLPVLLVGHVGAGLLHRLVAAEVITHDAAGTEIREWVKTHITHR